MYNSEKKTIISVLILYLTSTILLISILAYNYYRYEKEKLQEDEKAILLNHATSIYADLQKFHLNLTDHFKTTNAKGFNWAVYDLDKNQIFSNLTHKAVNLDKKFYYDEDYSYFIYDVKPYYMGAAFLVIEKKDHIILQQFGKNIILITLLVILIVILTSWFLVKLILKPIRKNLKLLDKFIKDTTHELNTPVSTIMTNVEVLKSKDIDEKIKEKINRIGTASKTISNIYEDLTFVVFNEHLQSKNIKINLNNFIASRVEYFKTLAKSKSIEIEVKNYQSCNLFIDEKKFCRLFDNLLSNSIKYSPRRSNILINIFSNSFEVIDEGKGLTKNQISKISQRYTRFDDIQGGFGLGFNIIYNIAKEYKLKIDIKSKVNEGTCIKIYW